ncbi:uncharacterized protein TEOVI_000350800 [Trypanosoma equiperdum]|uniref:Uncharacterized protein n=2 Tax=Trypanozoon TaxID=39700 RepID=Q57V91_TRYB2|nr:hypothetical protein, conserved [Trypanosoma brucei brucei TREU927]AAX70496.1 hypothetical protein, conserved [Trypanosoma brucei]AAZ13533.1 hypothetical protein, conserved [Trypanosoma brucei brucei TREU927]SCU71926.1 hypothetical protein, conserved [Trypanosoma equiperdum]
MATNKGITFQVIVGIAALLSAFIIIMICIIVIERRRLRNARARQNVQLDPAALNLTGEQLRHRLIRHAVDLLLADNYVCEGITLTSTVGVTEVLADRELRSTRGRPYFITTANGRRATISQVVQQTRASGQAPDSPPGPALMELLEKLQHARRAEPVPNEALCKQVEELMERLIKLEEANQRKDMKTDADEVYGKAAQYATNPANKCVRHVMNAVGVGRSLVASR